MQTVSLIVALGSRRYRVERPWGDLPNGPVTDVTVDSRGQVYVLLRWDPMVDTKSPRVIELSPDGRRLAREFYDRLLCLALELDDEVLR